MPSKSKTKGSNFEREIADKLNKAFNTDQFARVPLSGALFGKSNRTRAGAFSEQTRTTFANDITSPEWFPFSSECKNYKDKPNPFSLLTNNDATFDEWLGKTCFDASNNKQVPILFFKVTHRGTYVVLPKQLIAPCEQINSYLLYKDNFVVLSFDEYVKHIHTITDYTKTILEQFLEKLNQNTLVQSLIKLHSP